MVNSLGILGYDYVEFYVGSAKMWAYWHAKGMGLKLTAYSGPETGVEGKSSYLLEPPDSYYEMLRNENIQITESIDDLQENGILCDHAENKGYLLQLFTKPIGDRPTFFYEIIQRRGGAEGFGQGNFQALFESIEKDQMLRGNFDKD